MGMPFLRIVSLCVLAAVGYGIVHDQITAHLCVEYFTIGHARIVATESPVVLGIVWGVVATWWVGVLLGIPLALAARVGRRPRVAARELRRPILVLLAIMGAIATAAGLVGHTLAARGTMRLGGPLATAVPSHKHVAFITAAWVHSASYLAGFVGGVVLIVFVTVLRARKSRRGVQETPVATQARSDSDRPQPPPASPVKVP